MLEKRYVFHQQCRYQIMWPLEWTSWQSSRPLIPRFGARRLQNFQYAILYGHLKYQGIGVKTPYFLQEIIHIITFLNETTCNSSTGELLQSNAGYFRVEIDIPFSLTSTKYYEKTYASYTPSGWYKNLWRFMSNPLFKLEITEDYDHIPLLCKHCIMFK